MTRTSTRRPRPNTVDGKVIASAVISPCGTYRYELRRTWDPSEPVVEWLMLNPSTADANADDATIRRCVAFTRAWEYGGIVVRNLFALRATDPAALRVHADPVGPDNDSYLSGSLGAGALTVCAWGVHGVLHGRERVVRKILASRDGHSHHLGLTKSGAPRHPLYLRGDTSPTHWELP